MYRERLSREREREELGDSRFNNHSDVAHGTFFSNTSFLTHSMRFLLILSGSDCMGCWKVSLLISSEFCTLLPTVLHWVLSTILQAPCLYQPHFDLSVVFVLLPFSPHSSQLNYFKGVFDDSGLSMQESCVEVVLHIHSLIRQWVELFCKSFGILIDALKEIPWNTLVHRLASNTEGKERLNKKANHSTGRWQV